MKRFLPIILVFFGVIWIGLDWQPGQAQERTARPAFTVQGKIVSVTEQELKISAPSGDFFVKLADPTQLIAENLITLAEVEPGLFVGVAAQKQRDGTFVASSGNVFREEEGGLLEGHRPMTSLPNSTMTNATIERIEEVAVQNVKGPMLTLRYKTGDVQVFVPANTPIVKRVTGDKSMLKPGTTVRVQGTQPADGTITAAQITIRATRR